MSIAKELRLAGAMRILERTRDHLVRTRDTAAMALLHARHRKRGIWVGYGIDQDITEDALMILAQAKVKLRKELALTTHESLRQEAEREAYARALLSWARDHEPGETVESRYQDLLPQELAKLEE